MSFIPRTIGIACVLIVAAVAMARPTYSLPPPAEETHHFAFFARDRELLLTHPFLENRRFEGAQITYAWKQLERGEDGYDFGDIDADLEILKAHQKKLWIQLQDTTFRPNNQAVPAYVMKREKRPPVLFEGTVRNRGQKGFKNWQMA